jgi:hypothetical protein
VVLLLLVVARMWAAQQDNHHQQDNSMLRPRSVNADDSDVDANTEPSRPWRNNWKDSLTFST